MAIVNHNGKIVKEFREALNLSQEELGKKIGLTQQAISAIENQETIDDDRLKAIWKALNPDFNLLKCFQFHPDIHRVNNIENQSGAIINQIERFSGDYNGNSLERLAEFAENRVADIRQILDSEMKQSEIVRNKLLEASVELGKLDFYVKEIADLKERLAKFEE